jgi:molybdopterin converting factor small subunit
MARLLMFGQIAEITSVREMNVQAEDTQALLAALTEKFPLLKNAVYAVAVNQTTVQVNTPLSETDEVALLPPYSGG